MSTTADNIQKTISELTRMQAVQRHYDSIVEQEATKERNLLELEQRLTKELKDVEQLERAGVKSMFYKVLGSKQQQLEKERQEYLELSLKHSEYIKSLKVLQYEKEVIESKVINIAGMEQRLADLLRKREQELMSQPSEIRDRLVAIGQMNDSAMRRQGELRGATKKGKAALMSLDKVISLFRKAKDWGNWDMASNNGRYVKHRKHSAINNAVSEANRSNILLDSFSQDLQQIGYNAGNMSVGFKSFSGFMDVLFDNLISDWIMQSKIKNALSNTEAVRDRVGSIVATLENEYATITEKLHDLREQKEKLLSTH